MGGTTRRKKSGAEDSRLPSAVVAANAKSVRLARSLTQRHVADRMTALGHTWSRSTTSQVEVGDRSVSVDELISLAAALQTSVVNLMDPTALGDDDAQGIDIGGGVPIPPRFMAELVRGDDPPAVRVMWMGVEPDVVINVDYYKVDEYGNETTVGDIIREFERYRPERQRRPVTET